MNLTSRQLHAFVALARRGSFTRAAEDLACTQSGLSLMLKELENQVGGRLFDRTTRAVRLTVAGQRFLPVAQRTIEELETCIDGIKHMSMRENQEFTVAAPPLIAASILPAVCRDFVRDHLNVQLHVQDEESRNIVAMVEAGEIDIGVGLFLDPSTSVSHRKITRFSLIYLSPDAAGIYGRDIGKREDSIQWEHLPVQPIISLPKDNPFQQIIDDTLKSVQAPPPNGDICNHILTALGLVEAEFGCAILPSFVLSMCERYRVRAQRLIAPVVYIDLYMIARKGRHQPEIVQQFAQSMTEALLRKQS